MTNIPPLIQLNRNPDNVHTSLVNKVYIKYSNTDNFSFTNEEYLVVSSTNQYQNPLINNPIHHSKFLSNHGIDSDISSDKDQILMNSSTHDKIYDDKFINTNNQCNDGIKNKVKELTVNNTGDINIVNKTSLIEKISMDITEIKGRIKDIQSKDIKKIIETLSINVTIYYL